MKAAIRELLDSRPTTLPKPRERVEPQRAAALRESDQRIRSVLQSFTDLEERDVLRVYFHGGSMYEACGVMDKTRRLLRARGMFTPAEAFLRDLVRAFEEKYEDRFPIEAAA